MERRKNWLQRRLLRNTQLWWVKSGSAPQQAGFQFYYVRPMSTSQRGREVSRNKGWVLMRRLLAQLHVAPTQYPSGSTVLPLLSQYLLPSVSNRFQGITAYMYLSDAQKYML